MVEHLATVITNLLSAIPWIGKDFVEFPQILFSYLIPIGSLSTIGKVNEKALRGNKARTPQNKKEFINISSKFMGIFVGFVDGDGYLKINKTNIKRGYISIELVISLDLRDLELLNYIKSILKIGRIYIYKSTCKYIIGKVDLQEIVFPLLRYHNIAFLHKNRLIQYNNCIFILENNILKYNDYVIAINSLDLAKTDNNNIDAFTIVNLPYFQNWLIGFIIAEGSFIIKKSDEVVFTIRQRNHDDLFKAFQLHFDTNRKIDKSTPGHSQFSIQSVKDLTKLIDFVNSDKVHELIGYKKSQYEKFINKINSLKRFKIK